MKKKVLVIIALIVVLGTGLFVLTGCTSSQVNKDGEKIKEAQEESAEGVIKEDTIKMNSELDGVYAFANSDNKIVALKSNGTDVKILDSVGTNGDYNFSPIEYSAGKLYLAESNFIETERKAPPSGGVPVTQQKFAATSHVFYVVDLNKGNGNYKLEIAYNYVPDNSGNTYMPGADSPKVYNNALYEVKNKKDIIKYDLNTNKEEVIHIFKNDKMSSRLQLEKTTGYLYYLGEEEDGTLKMYAYDIANKKETVIVDKDAYEIRQVTKNGIYYYKRDLSSYDLDFNVYFYDMAKKEEIVVAKDYEAVIVIGENMYYTEATSDEPGSPANVVVKLSDGTTKTIKENLDVNDYRNGIFLCQDKLQIIENGVSYLVDNETFEIKKQDKVYRDIVEVNEYSNLNTNKTSKNTTIKKEDLIGTWSITSTNAIEYEPTLLFGTSMRDANELTFNEDGTYKYYVGVAYSETGSYTINGDTIKLTNIKSDIDNTRTESEFKIKEIDEKIYVVQEYEHPKLKGKSTYNLMIDVRFEHK